jgi:hypothetical protein
MMIGPSASFGTATRKAPAVFRWTSLSGDAFNDARERGGGHRCWWAIFHTG